MIWATILKLCNGIVMRMGFERRLFWGVMLPLVFSVAAGAENLYRYQNDRGVTVVDFRVPVEYVNYGYEVLDPDGRVVDVVPRALTAEERANVALARELEANARAEQLRLQKWDESLLLRYSTVADIEDARDRSLSDLKIRVSILKSNRRSLKQQAENAQARVAATQRAGADPMQADLDNIELLKREIDNTDAKIESRQQQIAEVTEDYQQDIDRFSQLQEVVDLRRRMETPSP